MRWKRILEREKHFYVDFSGGKDSLKVLQLIYENFPKNKYTVLYARWQDNTHPLCDLYVKKLCETLDVNLEVITIPRLFFVELLRRGCPTKIDRWCKTLKLSVLRQYKGLHVTGISERTDNVQLYAYSKGSDNRVLAPLLEVDVKLWLPLNPLYDIIGDSGNCIFCPFKPEEKIEKINKIPEYKEMLLDVLKHVQDRGGYITKWLTVLGREKVIMMI